MNSAQGLINSNTGYQPYTGATQADLHPYFNTGSNAMYNTLANDAAAGGTQGNIAARGLGLNMIQNQGLSPELRSLFEQAQGDQNPYLQSMLDTSNRQISNKIGSSMSGAGRYGSGQHTDVAARAMAEAADPVLAQDYARRQQQMQGIAEGGLQRAGQWTQLMPALDEARLAPAQGLMGLGQFYNERAQSQLNDQIKTYNAQQAYPWEQLARYNAIAGGAGGLGGTMTGSQTTPINQPSTLQKIIRRRRGGRRHWRLVRRPGGRRHRGARRWLARNDVMPRASWYSQLPPFGWFDREDRPGSAAYQVGGRSIPDSQQGIALPTRGGLGKWYNVTPPGSDRPFPMQQTDIGPAPYTGRGVDVSAAGAHQMGYSPKNFPTDANFKVEPIDLTGLGLAAKWNGGVPGDNQTAVAEGPPPQQGRKMPNSLMDMFQPRDPAGEPVGFGDAVTSRSNSLIGLGLGLLSPSNPLRGQSSWGQGLEGFQAGAQLDARTAQALAARRQHAADRAQSMAQHAADRRQAQSNWERQFDRSDPDAGPPPTRERFDTTLGRNVVDEYDRRTRQWKPATLGGGGPPTGMAPGPAGTAAPDPQPVMPPKKPLTAHEQTVIDKADEALAANQAVIGNLRDAKKLSPKAASGPYALERGQMGQHLPGFLGAGGKETVELHNIVTTNAVEQLKAVFGGNPTEGERKILIDLQGSASASDEVRQKIFDRAIEAAERRIETNRQKAQQIRGGTYYTPPAAARQHRQRGCAYRHGPQARHRSKGLRVQGWRSVERRKLGAGEVEHGWTLGRLRPS